MSSTVAPQSSILAQNNGVTTHRATENAHAHTTQNSAATGQVAVVSLTNGSSKGRGVSTGENRSVDATFEKQESSVADKDKEDKASDSNGVSGSLVNITA